MDYTKVKEGYKDSLSQYDIKKILSHAKLGESNFSELVEDYVKVAEQLYFLELNDYRETLFPADQSAVEAVRKDFIQNFDFLRNYKTTDHSPQQRTQWIQQFHQLFNQHGKILKDISNSLKLDKLLSSPDIEKRTQGIEDIDEGIKKIESIGKQFEERFRKIESLETSVEDTASATGQAETYHFFETQAEKHRNMADEKGGWLEKRNNYERIIFGTVILYIVAYVVTIFCYQEHFEKFWGYRSIVLFASLLLIEYVGLHFVTKNYSREKNLESFNLHRGNIARTIKPMVAMEDPETRKQIISNATKTLFSDIDNVKQDSSVSLAVGDLVANKSNSGE